MELQVLADNSDRAFVHLAEDLVSCQLQHEQQSHPLARRIAGLTIKDQSCLNRSKQTPTLHTSL